MRPPTWKIPLDGLTTQVLGSGITTPASSADRPTEWSVSDPLIQRHRLGGLLVHAVASGHIPATPEQRRSVALLEVDLTRNRVWHDLRLIEITEVLRDAAVDHRVLKGPAFGTLDYPDRIMRPTGDIDLLVRGHELARAVSTLVGRGGTIVDPEPVEGYARTIGKSTTVTMPDGLEIDLHRTLARGPFGVRMRPEDLWTSSRTFDIGGIAMTTLGLEESLIHACFHLMILSDKRALSVRDVAQFLTNSMLDRDRAIALSERWGAGIVLASAVQLSVSMIPAAGASPLVEWAASYRESPAEHFYLRIARPGATMGPVEWPATFMALRSTGDRRMLIRSILHPIEGTNAPFSRRVRRLMRRKVDGLCRSMGGRSNILRHRWTPESRDDPQQIGPR